MVLGATKKGLPRPAILTRARTKSAAKRYDLIRRPSACASHRNQVAQTLDRDSDSDSDILPRGPPRPPVPTTKHLEADDESSDDSSGGSGLYDDASDDDVAVPVTSVGEDVAVPMQGAGEDFPVPSILEEEAFCPVNVNDFAAAAEEEQAETALMAIDADENMDNAHSGKSIKRRAFQRGMKRLEKTADKVGKRRKEDEKKNTDKESLGSARSAQKFACPYQCGSNEIDNASNFCIECGQAIKFCPSSSCKRVNIAKAELCMWCGHTFHLLAKNKEVQDMVCFICS